MFLFFFIKIVVIGVNFVKVLVINDKYDEKSLLYFLSKEFPDVSGSVWHKALRKKDIRINNIKTSENSILHRNDVIKLYIADRFFEKNEIYFNIIYDDDNICIVHKPKGIEVTGNNSLTHLLQKKYNSLNILPCHRLDRNTNGLVIFAKSKISLDILLDKFKSNEISKFYKCKVYGIVQKDHEILKAYLFKDNKKSIVYICNINKRGYREIVTEYKVLNRDIKNKITDLEVILHTGRTHQIRAHLAYIRLSYNSETGKYGNYDINKHFKKSTQELSAYKLVFDFKKDARYFKLLKWTNF